MLCLDLKERTTKWNCTPTQPMNGILPPLATLKSSSDSSPNNTSMLVTTDDGRFSSRKDFVTIDTWAPRIPKDLDRYVTQNKIYFALISNELGNCQLQLLTFLSTISYYFTS